MIIILEGPDGAGKTTLANQLARQTGFPVIHRAQPKTEEEKAKMFEDYMTIASTSKNIILDRCWYSELVYGPVMRDKAVMSFIDMYKLEKMLAKRGAIIIYCTDNINKLWKRCVARGEDYIMSVETYKQIYDGYEELMSAPHIIPVVRYAVQD